MAIVHMKKLRLMVVRRQKDELLRDLMLLGCVQISEPDALLADAESAAVLRQESGNVTEVRSELTRLTAALKLLEQLPVKNRAVFDDLGHAVGKSFRRQQGEHVRIADDKRRLPERPDKIFSLWDINPGLASNG